MGPWAIPDHVINIPGMEGVFAYRVRDEAMLPMVRPGDYVVVETGQDPVLGDLVLVMMADGIVQVRRMSQVDNERVLSVSHPDYGPSVAMEETRTLGRINRIVRTVEV
jgi:SOS-response transcriptional repressor LexA